jgi:pimeloyl-ACP methyl ester carboxylesterase
VDRILDFNVYSEQALDYRGFCERAMTERLNVEIAGKGEPTLLFVHGFAGCHRDWHAQMAALSGQFRCIALDLPGHGGSDAPAQATISAMASAVNEARGRGGAPRVVLIGHGLGCKIVREAYLQSSEAVAGVVLIDGSFYEGDAGTLVRRTREAIDRLGFHAYAQQRCEAMFVDDSHPELREQMLARIRKLCPEFGRSVYIDAAAWDPAHGKETLCNLKVPVLAIQSMHLDSLFRRTPLGQARTRYLDTVIKLCERSRTSVIPGCGHFPMIEAADAVNREIGAFVAGLALPSKPEVDLVAAGGF